MSTCAVIVGGGRSSRMGHEKTFALVRGRSILGRIIEVLAAQVDAVTINANGDAERFGDLGLAVFGDERTDLGTPLAGLHAAMSYARREGFASVVTVPSDVPFLPADLLSRLAASQRQPAIAASAGQAHYLTGLWSTGLLPTLEAALDRSRLPRLQDWTAMCNAAVVDWPAVPYDPFFNVNTPEELAEAERIAAEFGA